MHPEWPSFRRTGSRAGTGRVISGLAAIAAGSLLGIAILLMGSRVEAESSAATSCGSGGNFFTGRLFNPSWDPEGARADIERTAGPDLCDLDSPPDTASSAWAMLAGKGIYDGWAQIGFVRKNYGSTQNRFFLQWIRSVFESPTTMYWGTPSQGNTYDFRASWYDSDNHIHMILDNTSIDETSWNPFNEWNGTQGQWFEETFHLGDDVFGTSGSKTDFDEVQTKNTSGNWVYQNWTGGGTGLCYYHTDEITGNSHFKSWTDPINHSC